jgi:SAM-dependent methyltransferase
MNCTEPEFWEQRYRANRMAWDQHGVPAALIHFLEGNSKKGTALIPGCGSGYEVKAFHEFDWRPLAVDFSPAAVERAHAVLGELASAVQLADFFKGELGGPFDVVYERTFLCSLPPERWTAYAQRMAELLKPGGRLVGLFAYGEEDEPPPFPLTRASARSLFGAQFMLAEDHAIPAEQSLPLFVGKERWQVWRRK